MCNRNKFVSLNTIWKQTCLMNLVIFVLICGDYIIISGLDLLCFNGTFTFVYLSRLTPGPTFLCTETSSPVIAWFRFDLVLPWQFVYGCLRFFIHGSWKNLPNRSHCRLVLKCSISHVVQLMPSFCIPSWCFLCWNA